MLDESTALRSSLELRSTVDGDTLVDAAVVDTISAATGGRWSQGRCGALHTSCCLPSLARPGRLELVCYCPWRQQFRTTESTVEISAFFCSSPSAGPLLPGTPSQPHVPSFLCRRPSFDSLLEITCCALSGWSTTATTVVAWGKLDPCPS